MPDWPFDWNPPARAYPDPLVVVLPAARPQPTRAYVRLTVVIDEAAMARTRATLAHLDGRIRRLWEQLLDRHTTVSPSLPAADAPKVDPREAALHARRTRNTGPPLPPPGRRPTRVQPAMTTAAHTRRRRWAPPHR